MNSLQYQRLAAAEDIMWYFRSLHELARLLLKQGTNRGGELRILDAGCGTGGFIRRMASLEPGWSIQGIDRSSEACGLAYASGVRNVACGTIQALPFEDGLFDAAVSLDVFYYLESPEDALRELARVTRPGGVAVLTVPAYQWLWSYHDVAVNGLRRFSRGELFRLLLKGGYEPLRITHWNALLLPLVVARRKVFVPKADDGDVRVGHRPVEAVLGGIASFERALIRAGFSWPFGANLVALARKR